MDTDHATLQFSYALSFNVPPQTSRLVYNFSRANFARLNEALTLATLVPQEHDANKMANHWSSKIKSIIKNHIPCIKLKPSRSNPWIDGQVRHTSNQKETARRKMHRTKKPDDRVRYLELNKNLKKMINDKYNNYILYCASLVFTNPKKFWSFSRRNKKSSTFPNTMQWGNSTADTPQLKATLFNNYFCSVFTIPNHAQVLPPITPFEDPNLAVITTNNDEVLKILRSLDPGKATGPDNIPARIMKECSVSLAPSLTQIINTSLRTGIVPAVWKQALVCPVHKKGPKKFVKNYRPISLLSIPSKVMEKCVFNAIYDRLDPQIHRLQHGFRKGFSTATQLLLVYDRIGKIVDERGQVDTIFLHFSKVFDSVPHHLLVHKLRTFGINGPLLEWFRSYLTGRKQATTVEGARSDDAHILSGVTQGSILGPILFLLYVNDMAAATHENFELALYADDAKQFCEIKNINDCHNMQTQIDTLEEWSNTWLLRFNVEKCNVMSITRKISPIKFDYYLGNNHLTKVKEFKDLGVIIQDNMLWDSHIRTQVKKANRMLYFINRTLGPRTPLEAKRLLYLSLVHPHLEYASIAWSPSTVVNLKLIESIQRRATIFITNERDLPYSERLAITKTLPLAFRRELLDAVFAHKAMAGSFGPDVQLTLSIRNRDAYPARNAQVNTLASKLVRTETYMYYYSNRIIPIWNHLPANIRTMDYKPDCIRIKRELNNLYWQKVLLSFDVLNTCTWASKCRCTVCRS